MRRPGWRRSLFFTAGLLLLTAAPAAPAQQNPPSPAFLEGTEVFRRLLYDMGQEPFAKKYEPLASFNDLQDAPHTILIVFGDAGRVMEVYGSLPSFVVRGGALFLATDKKLPADAEAALAHTAGVRVSGESVVCRNRDSCYHRLDYCPYLQSAVGADPDLFRDLIDDDSQPAQAASNAPSYLTRTGGAAEGDPSLPALAALPGECYREGVPAFFGEFDPPPLFAVGGDVGDGRVLVMADHSVFINEMLMQKDNGNIHLSYKCLKWLSGDKGERTRVLFVEDGTIKTRFDVPLKDDGGKLADEILNAVLNRLPDIADRAVPAFERTLNDFDEGGGADAWLQHALREMRVSPAALFRILAVALAVVVVLYGCWKVGWKARQRSDLQGPLLASALYRLAPAGGVPEQRQKAMIRGDNLWEPARDLARQFLTGAGVPHGTVRPRVEATGGWLRRWTMAGRVKRLGRLAYGPPARVSLAEWRRLLHDVKQLKAAMEKGTVRIT